MIFPLKEREISVKEEAIKREVQLDKIFSVDHEDALDRIALRGRHAHAPV